MTSTVKSYTDHKLNMYKVLSPILLLVSIIAYLFETRLQLPDADPLNIYIFPVLIVLFLLATVVMYKQPTYISYFEKMILIFIVIMYGLKFTYVVSTELVHTNTLGKFVFWYPLLHVFIFMSFSMRRALILSSAMYIWEIIVGIMYVPVLLGHEGGYVLFYYYLAKLVFIIALYFLQTLKQLYMRAELWKELAEHDYLTQLPNRRQIDTTIKKALDSAKEINYAIVLADIDNFKHINDTYGHHVGDIVLQEVAYFLRQSKGDHNFIGRWGGEEFIIVLRGDLNSTMSKVEELRGKLANHAFSIRGNISASFGVTDVLPEDSIVDVISRADRALYEAKSSGKNMVCMLPSYEQHIKSMTN
ncbi:GGDEF domain-containing protein [Bacillus sp. HMF5848]|uniref:GGDEF domain-containing protein n=1 Tax=Bacillus sp. HMF5848 TaxID=2495421 RepID=UPI000F79D763|nr:GGDEF domain-containing protein [Bacillus sp. HMF5848]RSK26692.1 GGDEF domain-containing protein [Bacillus sp. HMF5848]